MKIKRWKGFESVFAAISLAFRLQKRIVMSLFLLLVFTTGRVMAAHVPDHINVAVMDLGSYEGTAIDEGSLENIEKAASDYVLTHLVGNEHFDVMDKEMMACQIQKQHLDTVGLVDPESAKEIGALLGVPYIIYGNVVDVTASDTGTQILGSGVDVRTIQCHIMLRMMDVETGAIVMAAKGEGKSKSSLTQIGIEKAGTITIGSTQVTEISIHNALQKAAYEAANLLTERLYGAKKRK